MTALWVEILSWPEQAAEAEAARSAGHAVLLLIGDQAAPEVPSDLLVDWVRLPAAEWEVGRRVATLNERLERHSAAEPDEPTINDNVVWYAGQSALLSPVEAKMLQALLENGRAVLSRAELAARGWDEDVDPNTLDVAMGRLRRKVEPIGITLRTIRSRGFLVELDAVPEVSRTTG